MKFCKSLIGAAFLSFLIAPFAMADSGFYIGAKVAQVDPDADDFDVDDDTPVALQAGYDFGGFAIQGEFYSSENTIKDYDVDADLDVIGVYGVYRTQGFFYFMAKAGLVDGEVDVSGADFDDSDTVFSYGLGGGFNFGDFIFVEAEYVRYEFDEFDVDFLGLGANIKF